MEALRPIQQRYSELRADPAVLQQVLQQGRLRAAAVADATLARVQQALGFLSATAID